MRGGTLALSPKTDRIADLFPHPIEPCHPTEEEVGEAGAQWQRQPREGQAPRQDQRQGRGHRGSGQREGYRGGGGLHQERRDSVQGRQHQDEAREAQGRGGDGSDHPEGVPHQLLQRHALVRGAEGALQGRPQG